MLYANKETITKAEEAKEAAVALTRAQKATELNEAYGALERMRQLNLEIACQERGIVDIDYDECTFCLLEGAVAARSASVAARMSNMLKPTSSMPLLKRFVEQREKRANHHDA